MVVKEQVNIYKQIDGTGEGVLISSTEKYGRQDADIKKKNPRKQRHTTQLRTNLLADEKLQKKTSQNQKCNHKGRTGEEPSMYS